MLVSYLFRWNIIRTRTHTYTHNWSHFHNIRKFFKDTDTESSLRRTSKMSQIFHQSRLYFMLKVLFSICFAPIYRVPFDTMSRPHTSIDWKPNRLRIQNWNALASALCLLWMTLKLIIRFNIIWKMHRMPYIPNRYNTAKNVMYALFLHFKWMAQCIIVVVVSHRSKHTAEIV